MITKVTIQPYITITDPSWIKLWQYAQAYPFCKFKEIDFKNGKPFRGQKVDDDPPFGKEVEQSIQF